jgi:hypothetical protein
MESRRSNNIKSNLQPTKKYNFARINAKLVLGNALLLVGFFAVNILLASSVGTKSQEIDSIRSEKNELRSQNRILSAEIDRMKSLVEARDIEAKYNLVEKDVTYFEEADFDGLALKLDSNERN